MAQPAWQTAERARRCMLNRSPIPMSQKLTEAQMIDAVTNGSGKMQAFKGKLTDAQIKEAVDFFRSFIK